MRLGLDIEIASLLESIASTDSHLHISLLCSYTHRTIYETDHKMDENSFKPHWSIENVEKFINLYKQHECLWNPELDSYKNYPSKKSALHRIVTEMRMPGLTTTMVKDRIKSIRTMYRRELNKIMKSMASETNSRYVYKPKLFWFEQIDAFIRPVAVSRMDTTNLGSQSFTTSQNTEANEESDDNCSYQEQKAEDDLTDNTTPSEDHRPPLKYTSPAEEPRKKRKCSISDYHAHSEPRRTDNSPSEENQFDIFGKLIAEHLKKLPLITAIQCQQKIHDLVLSKRLEVLNYQNVGNSDQTDVSRATSPLFNFNDMEYEEKPNIVHTDILDQKRDNKYANT